MTDNVPWKILTKFQAIVVSIEEMNNRFPRQSRHASRQEVNDYENAVFDMSEGMMSAHCVDISLIQLEEWFDENQQTELPEYFYNVLVDELLAIERAMSHASAGPIVSLDFQHACQHIADTSRRLRLSSPLTEYKGLMWEMADVKAMANDEE